MDLEFNNGKYVEYLDGWFDVSGPRSDLKLKNIKTNTVYVNIGYGVTDIFEVFLRLGGTNARFSGTNFWSTGEEFDSNIDFAIGGGIKVTFYEEGKLKIGGLIQADWSDLDGAIRPKEWPVADDTVQFDLAPGTDRRRSKLRVNRNDFDLWRPLLALRSRRLGGRVQLYRHRAYYFTKYLDR
jgi:hypothetical protein